MVNNNSFQLYIKKLNYQILTKFFLFLFGTFLVGSGSLVLPDSIYLAIIVIYVAITFMWLKNVVFREYSHIVDMIFVLLLLYGTSINNYLTFAFLLYPLVSRGAYIDRFTYDKYFFLEFIALVIIVDLSGEKYGLMFYFYQVMAIIMFCFLNVIYVQRMKYDEKRIKMLDIADDYFIEQNKSYEVYKKILSFLEEQKILVSSITCLECDNHMRSFHLVNSSYLVSTFNLKLQTRNVDSLLRGMSVNNVDFTLDNKKQLRNVVYPVVQVGSSSLRYFLFVLVYKQEYSKLKELDLEPLFLRMSRLISFERIMRKKRDEAIQDMLQKSKFVNGATNIMHFLKNRLTPLQTLVDLVKNEGGVKQLPDYDALLQESAHSAQKEINVILEKAEYLLNKKNNPFVFSRIECDTQSIFITLSSIWTNLLPSSSKMEVVLDSSGQPIYETNVEGLEILFTDIVGNMRKYSKSIQRCSFRQDADSIITITFENDFGSKRDVTPLISDINNPNKDAVIYRTSYGVSNIRAIANNLSIGILANMSTLDDVEVYQLQLTFNPKENEENLNH